MSGIAGLGESPAAVQRGGEWTNSDAIAMNGVGMGVGGSCTGNGGGGGGGMGGLPLPLRAKTAGVAGGRMGGGWTDSIFGDGSKGEVSGDISGGSGSSNGHAGSVGGISGTIAATSLLGDGVGGGDGGAEYTAAAAAAAAGATAAAAGATAAAAAGAVGAATGANGVGLSRSRARAISPLAGGDASIIMYESSTMRGVIGAIRRDDPFSSPPLPSLQNGGMSTGEWEGSVRETQDASADMVPAETISTGSGRYPVVGGGGGDGGSGSGSALDFGGGLHAFGSSGGGGRGGRAGQMLWGLSGTDGPDDSGADAVTEKGDIRFQRVASLRVL